MQQGCLQVLFPTQHHQGMECVTGGNGRGHYPEPIQGKHPSCKVLMSPNVFILHLCAVCSLLKTARSFFLIFSFPCASRQLSVMKASDYWKIDVSFPCFLMLHSYVCPYLGFSYIDSYINYLCGCLHLSMLMFHFPPFLCFTHMYVHTYVSVT